MVRIISSAVVSLACGAASAAWASANQTDCLVECARQPTSTFSPDVFKPFKLLSSRYESHDARRFIFALDNAGESFSMPVASCVVVKFTDGSGRDVVRPYTPISSNAERGHFELLVKKYPKGTMGGHIFSLQPGEELLMKGPFKKFSYKPNMWRHVGMIAGGTGITPMYQLIRSVLENPKDKTAISLIYANNQRRDILLANELIELQKVYSNFHVYLTLLDVPHRWLGGIGHVSGAMISAFMPKPGEKDTKVLVCGPPPMLQAISGDKVFEAGKPPQQGPLKGLLRELGYTSDQVFKY